jgi:hypothetical protein
MLRRQTNTNTIKKEKQMSRSPSENSHCKCKKMTADVNAMKSKTSVASFQQTSQPRAVQTNAPKKRTFFVQLSIKSKLQPTTLQEASPREHTLNNRSNCHPANRFIATGTHSVFSHENQRCHRSGLFFHVQDIT